MANTFPQSAGKRLVGSLLLGLYDDEGLLQHAVLIRNKAMEKRGLTEKLEKIKAERSSHRERTGCAEPLVDEAVVRMGPGTSEFVIEVSVRYFSGAAFARHGTTIPFAGGRQKFDASTMDQLKTSGRGISCRQSAPPRGRKSGEILLAFFLWDALSFLSRLREPDSYGLLSAFDFTAFPAPATFRSAPFIATHLTFDVAARARGYLRFLFFATEPSPN